MPRKSKKRATPLHHAKRTVKHAVVPHKGNGYRPYAIRWKTLAALLLLVTVVNGAIFIHGRKDVLSYQTDITSQRLLDDTNDQRLAENVKPLAINQKLSAAATSKARDMFAHQYWAHTSPDGVAPWNWIKESGYSYSYAGENLAKGFRTSDALVTAWMNSPKHRENLLNPKYQEVGFAVVEGELNGETTKLVVAMYGSPSTVGASTSETVLAASGGSSLASRIGVALQTMPPAALLSIMLLMVINIVALSAHMYRNRLPKPLLVSWKRHHGLYKSIGTTSLVVMLIALYSNGQII